MRSLYHIQARRPLVPASPGAVRRQGRRGYISAPILSLALDFAGLCAVLLFLAGLWVVLP